MLSEKALSLGARGGYYVTLAPDISSDFTHLEAGQLGHLFSRSKIADWFIGVYNYQHSRTDRVEAVERVNKIENYHHLFTICRTSCMIKKFQKICTPVTYIGAFNAIQYFFQRLSSYRWQRLKSIENVKT